jgi:hypothetical protein
MKESLYDKYIDEHGVVDFGWSRGISQQKEAKRFLNALNKQSELEQKDFFSVSVCTFYFSLHLLSIVFVLDKRRMCCLIFQEIYSLADTWYGYFHRKFKQRWLSTQKRTKDISGAMRFLRSTL